MALVFANLCGIRFSERGLERGNVRPLDELNHKMLEIMADPMNPTNGREIPLGSEDKEANGSPRRGSFCWAAMIDWF